MAPSSAQYKFLHRREAPLEPPSPPNDTPNWIPVIVPQTGGVPAETAASIIVPLTVIPGVLLIGIGLWLIYLLYMRNQDRPVQRGGGDRERHPNTPRSLRPNRQSPERGHELGDRGGKGHVSRSGRNGGRGEITQPRHPTNEITSSTESVCGTDRGRAAQRGTPNPPLCETASPSPRPVIQKKRNNGGILRDDRNGRGSIETLRHSRSRSRSSAVTQNRKDIGATSRDDRRGRGSIEILRASRSRSHSQVQTESSHGKSSLTRGSLDPPVEATHQLASYKS